MSDALHRLNKMLFRLNQLESRAQQVDDFVHYCDRESATSLPEYSDKTDVAPVFMAIQPLVAFGAPDPLNTMLELELADLVRGVRRELVEKEVADDAVPISTETPENALETLVVTPFKDAVRNVFFKSLKESQSISGIDSFDMAPDGIPVDIWLYGLIAEYSAMSDADRSFFEVKFPGKAGDFFNGNYHAQDVVMPSINQRQINIIVTAINTKARAIKATSTWLNLVAEFSIGRVSANKIVFTRDDYKKWREILISNCGYDPVDTSLSGNRTEVSQVTHHEKWAPESEVVRQLSVTVLGGDLITSQGRCSVIDEIDYRVNKGHVEPRNYEACMVVENFEAFIFIHRFNLPEMGHVLVLYRGHDTTARAVINFLQVVQGIPIIGFTDPDPAGLGILNDWNCFTHALIPDAAKIESVPSLHDRFRVQLQARPNIKIELEGKSLQYQAYANWILEKGFAGTQELLCSRGIPLNMVQIR